MQTPHQDSTGQQTLDEAIAQFELYFRRSRELSVRDFVGSRPHLAPHLFFELVLLEFRLVRELGELRPTETQLEKYPELSASLELKLALIAVEIETNGDHHEPDRYTRRFPELEADIHGICSAFHSGYSLPTPGVLSIDGSASIRPRAQTAVATNGQPLDVGQRIQVDDEFIIEGLHNTRGGMKWVHRASQATTGRSVALKTAKTPMLSRLAEEGRLLAKLEHPNIPAVVTIGKTGSGDPVLAEVLLQGETWSQRLSRDEAALKNLSSEARAAEFQKQLTKHLQILRTLCLPLQYAHATYQLIHADLKPDNVIIGLYGEVYLLDWGLAVQVGEHKNPDLPVAHRSEKVGRRGTPNYAAPELLRGETLQYANTTDVYLLGAILYELLTGHAPFNGLSKTENLFRYLGACDQSVKPITSTLERPIPPELIEIVTRAMQPLPQDRYPTVQAFANAIEDYQSLAAATAILHSAQQDLQAIQSQVTSLRASKELHTAITPLIAVADRFRQVANTWPKNDSKFHYPPALQGEQSAREELIKIAEETGDYALATSQLRELAQLTPALLPVIRQSEARIQRAAKQRDRNRWIAKVGMLLVAMSSIALIVLGVVQHKTNAVAIENGEKAQKNAEMYAAEVLRVSQSNETIKRQRIDAQIQSAYQSLAQGDTENNQQWLPTLHNSTDMFPGQLRILNPLQRVTYGVLPTRIATEGLQVNAISINALGQLAIVGSSKMQVGMIWDLPKKEVVARLPVTSTPIRDANWSNDARLLFTAHENGLIHEREAPSFQISNTYRAETNDGFILSKLQVTSDLSSIVAVAENQTQGMVYVWKRGSAQPRFQFQIDAPNENFAHASWQIAIAPTNLHAYVILAGRWYRVSLEDGSVEMHFDTSGKMAYGIAVNQSGEIISSSSLGSLAKLDPKTLRVNAVFVGHTRVAELLQASSSNNLLVSAGQDKTVRLWNAETGEPLETLLGHQQPLKALALHPQGKWIASADEQAVFLWERDSSSLWKHRSLPQSIYSIAPMRNREGWILAGGGNETFASSNGPAALIRHNTTLPADTQTQFLQGTSAPPTCVATSKQEDLAAIGFGITHEIQGPFPSGRVEFFRGNNPEPFHKLDFPQAPVMRIAFHTTQPHVAIGIVRAENAVEARRGTIEIWNYRTLSKVSEFDVPYPYLTALEYSDRGDRLMVSSIALLPNKVRSEARVLATESQQVVGVYEDEANDILNATLTPDGESIVAAIKSVKVQDTPPAQIAIWNLKEGKVETQFAAHEGDVFCVAVSRDNLHLASGGADGEVMVWDLDGKKQHQWNIHEQPGYAITSVGFSEDSKSIFASALSLNSMLQGGFRAWDLTTERLLVDHTKDSGPVQQAALSSSGEYWVTAVSEPSEIQFIPVAGAPIQTRRSAIATEQVRGHQSAISRVVVSSDDAFAVTAATDNRVKIWDLKEGKVKHTLEGHQARVNAIAIAPSDQFIVSGTGRSHPMLPGFNPVSQEHRELRVWRTADGSLVKTIPLHAGVSDLAFSADGQLLAVALLDHYEDLNPGPDKQTVLTHSGEIQIWDGAAEKVLHSLHGREDIPFKNNVPTRIAFSRKGRLLAVGYHPYRDIVVWDLSKTPSKLATLSGHGDMITGLAFANDDSLLISGSLDQTVQVWKWQQETILTRFKMPMETITDMSANDQDDILVSGVSGLQSKLASFSFSRPLIATTWHDQTIFGRFREDALLDNVGKTIERRSFDRLGNEVFPHSIFFDYVEPGRLAESLGIREGDLLTSYNGKPMLSASEFLKAREQARNSKVIDTITIKRGSEQLTIELPPEPLGLRPSTRYQPQPK